MSEPANPAPDRYIAEYNALRAQLHSLSSAPVKDMAAIDATMRRLDEVHAAFKAAYGRDDAHDDHQRY